MSIPGTPKKAMSLDRLVRGTVVAVDMAAYSDIAKLLEENLNARAVAELNRQIQRFMTRALSQLPDGHGYQVISRPGDGMIALFERAEDAHCFSFHVHVFANEHNDQRSELIAERWFRVGIATGEVTANSEDSSTEYAGTTIANACRLESAAGKGEILIDTGTYVDLSGETKRLYGTEEKVQGKRSERFTAHRCRIVVPTETAPAVPVSRPNRRYFIAGGGITLFAMGLAGWQSREHVYSALHPLPTTRHVALLAWPVPPLEDYPKVAGLLDSIHSRLSRAEAYVKQLLIVTADDMSESHTEIPQAANNPLDLHQRALDWGANLVLGVQIVRVNAEQFLHLRLHEAESMKLIRERKTHIDSATSSDRLAAESAAKLLDLPFQDTEVSDEDELANIPVESRHLYDEARLLEKDPNGTKANEAIAKYRESIEAYPRFTLAFARLGNVYLDQFQETHDSSSLTLAGKSISKALSLNPSSKQARLARTNLLIISGQPKQALDVLEELLQSDPQNTRALSLKADALSQMTPPQPKQEEQVYRELIRNRPDYWYAYNAFGVFLRTRGRKQDLEEAARQFKAASLLMPKATTPLINLGAMYMDQNRDEDAKKVLEQSNLISKNKTAYENLGSLAFKEKKYETARELYLEAEKLNPKDHYVLSALGDCYELLRQLKKTNEYYTRAADELSNDLALNPNSGNLWMTLAFYHAKIGRAKSSESDMTKADEHGPEETETSLLRARSFALMGKRNEARALVLKCIDSGLPPVEVDLAPELAFVTRDPTYKKHLQLQNNNASGEP